MAREICIATENEALQHLFIRTFDGKRDVSLRFCESAKDALEKVIESPPHLLIICMNLPDRDGYELCRELKERDVPFPILLMEDIFEDIDPARCNEVQADGFITKPFNEDLIAEKVNEVLRKEKAVAENVEGNRETKQKFSETSPSTSSSEEASSQVVAESEKGETAERAPEKAKGEDEEELIELTDLIKEEEIEAPSPTEELPLEEAVEEPEVPPLITSVLEESASELEKMEEMEAPPLVEDEIPLPPPTPPPPEIDQEEMSKLIADIVGRVVDKKLEERLPEILKKSLARLLMEISEALK